MISFGIPLEESYLRYRLSVLMKEENNSLRKGRLYIPDSYNLMGTADPTGTLKEDEVCVILYVSFSGRARIQKTISDIKLCCIVFVERVITAVVLEYLLNEILSKHKE